MNTISLWRVPTGPVELGQEDVHVWKVWLDVPATVVIQYQQYLSAEEQTKAQQFRFDRDRKRWIVAHAVLRLLLSQYLQSEPQHVHFRVNAYGKPELAAPSQGDTHQFNISHSADLALLAFTRQRHLGVDVEYMRRNIPYDEIANYSFSPSEQAILRDLPMEQKHQAFYNCWSRKEAYIKARGMGLSLPLDLFDVSLLPGEPTALLQSRESPQEVLRWSMQELLTERDYAGALMVEGRDWQLRLWQWPGLSMNEKNM